MSSSLPAAELDAPRPLRSHVAALRGLLIRVALCLLGTTLVGFFGISRAFHMLISPYTRLLQHTMPGGAAIATLQTLDPSEAFRLSMTVALAIGAALTLPYAALQGWQFLRPGLHAREQRLLRIGLCAGTGLFIGGAAFAFFVVVPMLLQFFWHYSLSLGLTPNWTIGAYCEFVMGQLLSFGAAFELPLVLILLVAWRLVTTAQIAAVRRYLYFVIFVIAAALTPPDLISCLLMGIPLILLYEGAMLVARAIERQA